MFGRPNKMPRPSNLAGDRSKVAGLFVHCKDCCKNGRQDTIAVIILDGEVLQVVCENHPLPKPILSITIPLEERNWI